jgi:hypothetical protein
MALAANALISLAEFRALLSTTDTSKDAFNEPAINAASQDIETELNQKLITPSSALTEIFTGDGQAHYFTKYVPIITVSILGYRTGSGGTTWQSVFSDWNYETDLAGGRIYFVDGNVFLEGQKDNWRIGYTYGYAIASVPQDIKIACASLAALYKVKFESNLHGQNSKNFGETSITYSFDAQRSSILKSLAKYKRMICR